MSHTNPTTVRVVPSAHEYDPREGGLSGLEGLYPEVFAHDASGKHLPRPGTLIAERFLIERELGRGGMGVVYAARDQRMQRRVALKWLRSSGLDVDSGAARLLREAFAAIEHPNVISIYDVDVERPFLVMELLSGQSLAQRIKQGGFEVEEACRIILQALDGLGAVHARGLVHRDLKPANLFLAQVGDELVLTKLLDFGIAKYSEGMSGLWNVTAVGTRVGTPMYMAPEQLVGQRADTRADLYALSVVLYELLAGRLPYRANNLHDLSVQVRTLPLQPPSRFREGIPQALEKVVLKGLRVRPEERYQDVRSMATAIRAALAGTETVATKPARWLGRHVLLAALGLLGALGLLIGLVAWTAVGGESALAARVAPPLPPAAAEAPPGPADRQVVEVHEREHDVADLLHDVAEVSRLLRLAGLTDEGFTSFVEELDQLSSSDGEEDEID